MPTPEAMKLGHLSYIISSQSKGAISPPLNPQSLTEEDAESERRGEAVADKRGSRRLR
ncbi:MAG: hypothetical protein KME21_29480 [Desmonostoc vinosum HA7617-LM4]|nr:hypothetical protein [Desmonostoc vinosum HA7617-LM4]